MSAAEDSSQDQDQHYHYSDQNHFQEQDLHEQHQHGQGNSEREAESALLSLGQSTPPAPSSSCASMMDDDSPYTQGGRSSALSNCPRSHQLPMFLSKTYHMIDRCEPAIATWSMDGSNFVVKNVEKFASGVLPLYFKHSNFSSFARQLNFYGFRKLRTDPILTSDVDPRTACYVRFYHEKFQKDRPELLHQIKRATKSDQQSKDEVESLKAEVSSLRNALVQLKDETDRRLAEMSYESNRRITSMGAEYDKLASLVHQFLPPNNNSNSNGNTSTATSNGSTGTQPPTATGLAPPSSSVTAGVQNALRNNPHAAAIAAAAAVAAVVPPPTPIAPAPQANARMPDLMESLSQAAAISLQQQAAAAASNSNKRPAEGEAEGAPPAKQQSQQEMAHV